MGEGIRVRRVVRVHQDVAGRQLGGVIQDGRFQLAQLLQNEGALLAAGELDRVDGRAGFDGGVVRRGEGPGEEGVQQGGLARRRTAQDVREEHVPLHPGAAFPTLPGLGQVERGRGGRAGLGGREAEVGEVGEGGGGGEEGGHAPLGEPALQGDVAGFIADGGGGEGGVEPGGREAGGGGEQGGELRGVQAAVVVFVEQEEEVDEKTIAGRREFDGGVGRDVKFGSQEAIAEAEAVGVMKLPQDDPDGLVTAPFGKDFAQQDETGLVDSTLAYRAGSILPHGLLDLIEIVRAQGFAEAFGLKIMDLAVIPIAVLIAVAQIEDALQGGDARRFQGGFFGIEQGRDGVRDGFLTQVEDLVDVEMFPGAGPDAGIDLLELGQHREHLILDDLFGGDIGRQVRLAGAQDDGNVDAQGPEVRHPEQGHALIAVVIGIEQQDDIGLADFLVQTLAILGEGRGVDDGGGDMPRRADGWGQRDLGQGGLDLGGDKHVLHQGGDEARLARPFVPTEAYAN